jgi:pimeloyl-ACP methyl ester carboxylesterase
VTVAALAALVTACADPARRADGFASHSGFHKEIVTGTQFRHLVYRNFEAHGTAGVLHVYIEGDGTPFSDRETVSPDPTPRNPLMLHLMALDPQPSLYLGRPCYFELHDGGCNPSLWTQRRYALEVVDSLEAVLRAQSTRAGAARIEIYGHSGGGTLAVILAQRVAAVSRVVTLGANLDTAAWCSLHRYTPLAGSINPAAMPPPRKDLEVLHLVGAADTNTPPWLIEAAARARGGETVQVIPKFDHVCCWQSVWPQILRQPAASRPSSW